MQMLQRGGPLPREIVTRKVAGKRRGHRRRHRRLDQRRAASAGDRQRGRHIASRIDDVGEVFARTPLIGNLRPGGKYTAKDVYDIGGAAVVIRALIESGHIDGDCLTITGRTIAEEYGDANAPDGEVIYATGAPIMPDGGVAVLKGNLCPDGAVIKVAGLKKLVFEGGARVFEDEEACVDAVRNRNYARGRGARHPQ